MTRLPGPAVGLKREGNININDRPNVYNPETKGYSSVWSTSFGNDEGEVLVPRITDGEDGKPPHILNDQSPRKGVPSEAEQYYNKYHKFLGVFSTIKAANAYGEKLHEQQAKLKTKGDRLTQ